MIGGVVNQAICNLYRLEKRGVGSDDATQETQVRGQAFCGPPLRPPSAQPGREPPLPRTFHMGPSRTGGPDSRQVLTTDDGLGLSIFRLSPFSCFSPGQRALATLAVRDDFFFGGGGLEGTGVNLGTICWWTWLPVLFFFLAVLLWKGRPAVVHMCVWVCTIGGFWLALVFCHPAPRKKRPMEMVK